MNRIGEWLLAALGSVSCIGGAALIASQQPGPLWPLPGLVLIEWVLLGLAGLLGVALDNWRHCVGESVGGDGRGFRWDLVTSAVCGALVALMVMGALSIGPLALVGVLAFGGAGLVAAARKGRLARVSLLTMLMGLLVNFAVLTTLVASISSSRTFS